MSIETIKVIMPSHWASYIINGDASVFDYIVGWVDGAEQEYVDGVIENYTKDGWIVSGNCSEESFFCTRPDHSYKGLANDCLEYELFRKVN